VISPLGATSTLRLEDCAAPAGATSPLLVGRAQFDMFLAWLGAPEALTDMPATLLLLLTGLPAALLGAPTTLSAGPQEEDPFSTPEQQKRRLNEYDPSKHPNAQLRAKLSLQLHKTRPVPLSAAVSTMTRDCAAEKMNCISLLKPASLPPHHPMIPFVVFFITIIILVIFLATKQRRPLNRFCLTAICLLCDFCVLAATSVVLLRGTNLFPASAFALAALLLAQRSIVTIPPDLDAAESVPSSCASAARDASNHSTWIVAAAEWPGWCWRSGCRWAGRAS
jgi:hypothetical protein